jgi:hypothetical protein
MEKRVQLSWCKSSGVLYLYPLSRVPLQVFEFSTNGFVDVVLGEGEWRSEHS